ncbi:MAG: gamma-glutamyl-gamma-aminobutyrate hydrolase family protein [Actinomycetes bacterium]
MRSARPARSEGQETAMKPVVGITAWRRTLTTAFGPDRLHTIACDYTESLERSGLAPLVFPAGLSPDDAPRLVSRVDGVLLSGGEDVDPSFYGQETVHSRNCDPEVDRFELAVIEAARELGKPLLAICRGLQILNVAFGGTLHQEVTSPGGVHDTIAGATPEEMHARRHEVSFPDGSLLAALYGAASAAVNTLHHQGIDRPGEGLTVEAVAADGLIEGIRHDGDWWAVGVQWHPEKLEGDHQRIFTAFREAIDQSRSREAV